MTIEWDALMIKQRAERHDLESKLRLERDALLARHELEWKTQVTKHIAERNAVYAATHFGRPRGTK